MSRKSTVLVVVVACAILMLGVVVDPAFAQQSAGEGIGKMFQGWAKWLIPGVAAIVGIPALARHDIAMMVGLLLVVMVLGAFAWMSADDLEKLARPIINSFTGA
jgi:hypothetical protein